jgi:hypothetical protein
MVFFIETGHFYFAGIKIELPLCRDGHRTTHTFLRKIV